MTTALTGKASCPGVWSAYPQIRFVSLVENGTHVLFTSRMADYAPGETSLTKAVLAGLEKGMLCLADRQLYGFALWTRAQYTGAASSKSVSPLVAIGSITAASNAN